jgi:hypothetical protein
MHRNRGLRVLIPKRVQAEKAILFLSITVASGLLMVSVYKSLVDAKSWGFDIPASIQRPETCYKKHCDPRRFYAVKGPLNQVLSLLPLVLEGFRLPAPSFCNIVFARETGNAWFHWPAEE